MNKERHQTESSIKFSDLIQWFSTCGTRTSIVTVRKGFLGGTRVTSIIFIEKPGFTAFWYFI